MLNDPMPGATLEAPDAFIRLAAPLWPRLPLALGYSGGARWVAFYLVLDRVTYNDGASSGTGDTSRVSRHSTWCATRTPKNVLFVRGQMGTGLAI